MFREVAVTTQLECSREKYAGESSGAAEKRDSGPWRLKSEGNKAILDVF
jgi:hypothetical protein